MTNSLRPARRDFLVAGLTIAILVVGELLAFKTGLLPGTSNSDGSLASSGPSLAAARTMLVPPMIVMETATEADTANTGANSSLVEFRISWQPTAAGQAASLTLSITTLGSPTFLNPTSDGTKSPVLSMPLVAKSSGWVIFAVPNSTGLSADGIHHTGTLQAAASNGELIGSWAVVW